MGKLRQTQAGNQRQYPRIGDGPGIVSRVGFTAKGKGDRLGLRAAGQVINGIPGGQQRQRQQHDKRNAYSGRRVEKRQRLDGDSPQPIRKQRIKTRGLSEQLRLQPIGRNRGEFAHDAKRCDVLIFPGAASQKSGKYIRHAKQEQRPARQAANGGLGNDGGRWFVQNNGIDDGKA